MSSLFDTVLDPLRAEGVNFWWLDWQQWPDSKKLPGLSNTWWLNYVFYTHMQLADKDRALIYHRWGGLGNHRYQVGFSGDSVISWQSLAYQPYFTATASNVLYGYWSHDIGGHMFPEDMPESDRHIDPELYVRWMQFGAFSPILRTHSSKEASLRKEPWRFSPEVFAALRQIIDLRYAMAPYIYTASREAYDSGVSLMRPLYYAWPDEAEGLRRRQRVHVRRRHAGRPGRAADEGRRRRRVDLAAAGPLVRPQPRRRARWRAHRSRATTRWTRYRSSCVPAPWCR